jgi:hypothetical protein
MMKLKTANQTFITLVMMALLGLTAGCVGTVETSEKDKTITRSDKREDVKFQGVYEAVGISDTKVEVYFYPATAGSEKYDYIIHYGGSSSEIIVPSDVLEPDYRGLLKYTLSNLQSAYPYVISVDAADQDSGFVTKTDVMVTATTFGNKVCDFYGVGQVTNLQGVDGMDSIKVRWPHAGVYGDVFNSAEQDPVRYEIVAIDAGKLSPGDFDNTSLNGGQGRFQKTVDYNAAVNEVVMRGLPSDTDFYVRVRCIHEESVDDYNDPRLRGEMNNTYRKIKTLNGDLSSLEFDPDSLVIERTSGAEQTSSLKASWGEVKGVFDHFRLYYSQNGVILNAGTVTDECVLNEDQGTGIFCKKLSYKTFGTIAAGLKASKDYQFLVMVCQKPECGPSERVPSTVKLGSTFPLIAGFSGLDKVQLAQSVFELGSVKLTFTPPDFTNGYFDGYIVGYKNTPAFLPTFDKISEEDYQLADGTMQVLPYDHETAASITVNGINYLSGAIYCFTVYPFIYNSDGDKVEYQNNVWKCEIPSIEGPDKEKFPGMDQGMASGSTIAAIWNAPGSGIYDRYEVYYRKTAGQFSFSEAIQQTTVDGNFTNYGRMLADPDDTMVNITNLPNGSYQVGVLSVYTAPNGIIRSEFNENIFTCNVDAGGFPTECSNNNPNPPGSP